MDTAERRAFTEEDVLTFFILSSCLYELPYLAYCDLQQYQK